MAKVVTMILAGGQGTRLYPLTKDRSKPAVPIAGKFRLIDIPISNCIHSGYRKIYVCTQFSAESLHRHINTTYRFSIFSRDFITILTAQQTLENRDWYQGTADAVRQNLRFIQDVGDYVLILSGDHLYRMDYSAFVDDHIRKNADISIGVIPVNEDRASQFGIMKIDPNAWITTFHEKPKDPAILEDLKVPDSVFQNQGIESDGRSHLASMGIYVFNTKVLIDLLDGTPHSDFGKEVIPYAISNNKVSAHFFNDYWEDIGTISAFFEAHIDLTRALPKFNFYDEVSPIYSRPRFLPAAKVLNARAVNTLLGDGSIVNPSSLKDSIIGIRSIVGNNCDLERVIMMGADLYETPKQREANRQRGIPDMGIGDNTIIKNAILDKNARIGKNVRILNERNVDYEEGKQYFIKDGIVVIGKNAYIADGTVI